jgi:hypothetical protein
MCRASAFHPAPRPLEPPLHALAFSSPLASSIFSRVTGRFHCRHSTSRSLRRIPPSGSSTPFFTSARLKYFVQPQRTCRSWPLHSAFFIPRAPRNTYFSLIETPMSRPASALSLAFVLNVTLSPRPFRFHGLSTALFSGLTLNFRRVARN